MKLSITSATLALALATSITAAPTYADTSLAKREDEGLEKALALIEEYNKNKDSSPSGDLATRDYSIVTEFLTALKNTDIAPGLIQGLVDDPNLSKIATKTLVAVVKSNIIDLTTLMKGLNDSGLLVQLIQDIISDCQFYATIYKIALKFIGNLAQEIADKIGGNNSKRGVLFVEELSANSMQKSKRASEQEIITQLLDSVRKSGLADQIVAQLVTDEQFYTWGADLIKQLFEQKAITLPQLILALAESGLIPSLFENFFNFDTLKEVVVNALAAFFGKCGQSTSLPSSASTTVQPTKSSGGGGGSPTSLPTSTNTSKPLCKKKKRSYH